MKQKRIMILGGNIVQMEATLEAKRQETYKDIQDENWDADVCDTFFQIAVFGEVVFG